MRLHISGWSRLRSNTDMLCACFMKCVDTCFIINRQHWRTYCSMDDPSQGRITVQGCLMCRDATAVLAPPSLAFPPSIARCGFVATQHPRYRIQRRQTWCVFVQVSRTGSCPKTGLFEHPETASGPHPAMAANRLSGGGGGPNRQKSPASPLQPDRTKKTQLRLPTSKSAKFRDVYRWGTALSMRPPSRSAPPSLP